MKKLSKSSWLLFIAMVIMVPFAGEIQFYPYEGAFRISFGTPIFLFFLLYFRQLPPRISGIFVGCSVVLFRIGLELFIGETLETAIELHTAVFFYYASYGWLFNVLNIRKYYQRPLFIGLNACILEIGASIIEITFRHIFTGMEVTIFGVFTVIVIAIIRNFFVMGFFMIIMYHELKIQEKENRAKNEQILLLISNLYVEIIQLQKSITTAETVTRDCYHLYRELIDLDFQEQGKRALKIAGDVHECKKDNQRIYAGLSKLMQNQNQTDDLELQEMLQMIVHTNETYATHLRKKVAFHVEMNGQHPRYQAFFILSILNNLVANSIEAIKETGNVRLQATINQDKNTVIFLIGDDGPGIQKTKADIIFTPGFTTKYDNKGEPSNGIGLSYVKGAIEAGEGTIKLVDSIPNQQTLFKIELPIASCVKKGGGTP